MDEDNRNQEDNVNEAPNGDSSDDDSIELENPNEIRPVIEEEKNEEKEDDNETPAQIINREDVEIMYTEMLSVDIFSLIKNFFNRKSLKHLKEKNCDKIRNWIITRTARVTLHHCFAFIISTTWEIMSLITFLNLRRLLDLIRILAHMYRKRKTTIRHVKPEKRNYWLKKKKRPDDERNPDRPQAYVFKNYDRMVRSTPFLHHLGQRDIDTLVDMVSKMYTKDGDLFMALLDFSNYRFDIEWIWAQMRFEDESPRSDEADDRNSTNDNSIQDELKSNNDVDKGRR